MISSLSARFDSSSTVFSPNSLPQSPSLNFTADDKAILKSVSTRSLLAKFGGGGGGGGKFGVGAQSRQSNPSSSSIKTSSSSSQFKLKYTIKPLTHHHHHHHGTPSPVFSLLTDQPGSYSPLSSFGIDATPILSVRLLREIFERLARDNGWNHISTSKSTSSSRSSGGSTSGGDQMKWMNLIRQKIENGSVEMTVKREDGSVDVDGIMNQLRLDPEFGGGGADISKQEQVQNSNQENAVTSEDHETDLSTQTSQQLENEQQEITTITRPLPISTTPEPTIATNSTEIVSTPTSSPTKPCSSSASLILPPPLTPSRRNKSQLNPKHECDMIVCGVKSFTHNGHKVHEIDLKCHSCDSQFVLTAAHDCEAGDDNDDDGDRGEGEGDLLALREGKEEEEEGVLNGEVGGGGLVGATNEGTTGLEWLTNGEISLVNMII